MKVYFELSTSTTTKHLEVFYFAQFLDLLLQTFCLWLRNCNQQTIYEVDIQNCQPDSFGLRDHLSMNEISERWVRRRRSALQDERQMEYANLFCIKATDFGAHDHKRWCCVTIL